MLPPSSAKADCRQPISCRRAFRWKERARPHLHRLICPSATSRHRDRSIRSLCLEVPWSAIQICGRTFLSMSISWPVLGASIEFTPLRMGQLNVVVLWVVLRLVQTGLSTLLRLAFWNDTLEHLAAMFGVIFYSTAAAAQMILFLLVSLVCQVMKHATKSYLRVHFLQLHIYLIGIRNTSVSIRGYIFVNTKLYCRFIRYIVKCKN